MREHPRFRTEGQPPFVKLFLQCSRCEKDIREILPDESIAVDRNHYCSPQCAGGENVIRPNFPTLAIEGDTDGE